MDIKIMLVLLIHLLGTIGFAIGFILMMILDIALG